MNETSFEELGLKLKTQREAKGLSLRDIADRTRIPLSNLEALEAGDPRGLPASVFVKGFLRSYALEIGLKPDDVIHEYKTINLQQEENLVVEKKARDTGRSLDFLRKLITPAIALAAILLIVFYIYPWLTGPDEERADLGPVVAVNGTDQPEPAADAGSGSTDSLEQPGTQTDALSTGQPEPVDTASAALDQPTRESTPDVASPDQPQPDATTAQGDQTDTTSPASPDQPPQDSADTATGHQPEPVAAEPQDQTGPAAGDSEATEKPATQDSTTVAATTPEPDNSVAAAPVTPLTSINYTPPEPQPEPQVVDQPRTASLNGTDRAADTPSVISSPAPVEPPAHGHELKVVFEEETWIQVMIDSNQDTQHGFYPAGTSRTWQAEEGFSVRIGNAGGVKIIFDGRDLGSPGQPGTVVKINLPQNNQ